jgi:hypothetical protein
MAPLPRDRGCLGGCSFIQIGDDPDIDQEMYLNVYNGAGQVSSPARPDPIAGFAGCAPGDVIRLIAEIRRLRG